MCERQNIIRGGHFHGNLLTNQPTIINVGVDGEAKSFFIELFKIDSNLTLVNKVLQMLRAKK